VLNHEQERGRKPSSSQPPFFVNNGVTASPFFVIMPYGPIQVVYPPSTKTS